MNYYKVVLDGKVIDVLEGAVWVRINPRGREVLCMPNEATGVVSSDGNTLWSLAGTAGIPGAENDAVNVVDITKDEADELKTLLDLGGEVTENPGGTGVEFPSNQEQQEDIPENATLKEVKRICLDRLSNACQQVIFDGFDVIMTDGSTKHFTLRIEDQLNLLSLSTMVASGAELIPYHASGELCEFYSVEDMIRIITAATELKTYHTSYFNSLKNWVESMDDIAGIGAVTYGDQVPEAYCSIVFNELTQAAMAVDKE